MSKISLTYNTRWDDRRENMLWQVHGKSNPNSAAKYTEDMRDGTNPVKVVGESDGGEDSCWPRHSHRSVQQRHCNHTDHDESGDSEALIHLGYCAMRECQSRVPQRGTSHGVV